MIFITCELSRILTSSIVARMYIMIHLNIADLRPCNSQACSNLADRKFKLLYHISKSLHHC